MPLDMPESVLVRFKGQIQPGITLRDLVNAIPYAALQRGLLTVGKEGKKNCFSGRILKSRVFRPLPLSRHLSYQTHQQRPAGGCTIKLDEAPIREYLESNITLLKWMIADGYGDARTIARRITAMQSWLAQPDLMEADADAEHVEIIEIDLNEIREPLLACPNDPDDVKCLSEIQGTAIDEVFIGSCMTNIGHYRAAGELLKNAKSIPTRLWIAPPTRMDENQLMEGVITQSLGQLVLEPKCPAAHYAWVTKLGSLMTQLLFRHNTQLPNRLGKGADVFLASAELAAVASIMGKLPTVAEYMEFAKDINAMADKIYRYMNFHQIAEFQAKKQEANIPVTEIA